MIISLAAADKSDEDLRINARAALAFKIWAGGKGQPIRARRSVLCQIVAAPVGVGLGRGDGSPSAGLTPVELMPLKAYSNTGSRFAQCCIQNVCGDFTHGSTISLIEFA